MLMSGLVFGLESGLMIVFLKHKKVEVGNGQEKAHSERNSHSKNRGGKN